MEGVVVAATVVIAFSAIASLCVTWRLSQDNRALRKAATEPRVVAYLDTVGSWTTAGSSEKPYWNEDVVVVFANVGESSAKNVEASCDGDSNEFADCHAYPPTGRVTHLLPPGQHREMRLGNRNHLTEPQPMTPFTVAVAWRDLGGREFAQDYELDVGYLSQLPFMINRPPSLATTLSAIESHLQQLVSRVDSDRQEERH